MEYGKVCTHIFLHIYIQLQCTIFFLISGLHIFLLLSAAVFSIVCTVFFHILIASFDVNCVLYPKEIFLLNITNPDPKADDLVNFNSTYNQIGSYSCNVQ